MIRFEPASFKDPAGRVFYVDVDPAHVYRTLDATAYSNLVGANALLATLVADGLVVEHELREAGASQALASVAGPVLVQRRVRFVSYPYEWGFGMLRDAALLTLTIMERSLAAGFVLKDANGFNVLFDGMVPKLVDLPSLERHVDGRVWAAYGQFCRSFLFPLLLTAYRRIPFQPILQGYLGEIPPRFVASLLGWSDWRRPGVLKDVVLQARLEASIGRSTAIVVEETAARKYPTALLLANVKRLRTIIERLQPGRLPSDWSGYADSCTYSDDDRAAKETFVTRVLARTTRRCVVDLGCNTGHYSRLAIKNAEHVIAIDLDPVAIDGLYRETPAVASLSPAVGNLLQPTPAMGWGLAERQSLLTRCQGDVFLALALIHHLRITGGVPLEAIADQLFAVAPEGVIEWIDKSDSQVQRMLALRPDVYGDYTWESFSRIISARGELVASQATHNGNRRLCHVKRRTGTTA